MLDKLLRTYINIKIFVKLIIILLIIENLKYEEKTDKIFSILIIILINCLE